MSSIPISVTILTKNSAKTVQRTLESLQAFDQVLIYDTGSTDQTLEIAKKFDNVTIHCAPFEGFGPSHNKASELARYNWILSIDSDEWLSNELLDEICSLQLDKGCVYALRRKNFYQGQWIWSCGWYPDWQKKLYNRKSTSFTYAMVHEAIDCNGHVKVCLRGHLNHEPYQGVEHFLEKMQHYSTLFAHQSQNKKANPVIAIAHGLYAFFKSYILKRGILQGYAGWLISMYNGHCALYKYLKLYQKQQCEKLAPSGLKSGQR